MEEFIQSSLSLHTFPFTLMLILCFGFWIFVIAGAFDMSAFDIDIDMDGDVDVDAPDFISNALSFMNLNQMPVMIPFSTLITMIWLGISLLNVTINTSGSWRFGLLLLIPVIFGAILVTKVITTPLAKVFAMAETNPEDQVKAIGSLCELQTDTDKDHGRALIQTKNAPIQILVYCAEGETLKKGDKALVLLLNEKKNKYLIEKTNDFN